MTTSASGTAALPTALLKGPPPGLGRYQTAVAAAGVAQATARRVLANCNSTLTLPAGDWRETAWALESLIPTGVPLLTGGHVIRA